MQCSEIYEIYGKGVSSADPLAVPLPPTLESVQAVDGFGCALGLLICSAQRRAQPYRRPPRTVAHTTADHVLPHGTGTKHTFCIVAVQLQAPKGGTKWGVVVQSTQSHMVRLWVLVHSACYKQTSLRSVAVEHPHRKAVRVHRPKK